MVQEPTWPFLKERRRYCHLQGSMTGLAEGWGGCDRASVLEDSLVGLVYMLGHLRCSTLQGQLQEKRRQGIGKGVWQEGDRNRVVRGEQAEQEHPRLATENLMLAWDT